jgi:mannose-6-phosphate isomerase-like protein (cupin superfamily)
MEPVNLADVFSRFSDRSSPKVVGDINDMQVKAVKLIGEFVWHHRDTEDELFLVQKGRLLMRCDSETWVVRGEFIIVPHGVEYQPSARSFSSSLRLRSIPETCAARGR